MTKYPLRQQKQESGKFSLSIILEIQILETQMRPESRIRTFKLNRFLSLISSWSSGLIWTPKFERHWSPSNCYEVCKCSCQSVCCMCFHLIATHQVSLFSNNVSFKLNSIILFPSRKHIHCGWQRLNCKQDYGKAVTQFLFHIPSVGY